MFGYMSNSIGFGQRPSIKATITRANLTATVTATVLWYDFSNTGTGYSVVPNTAINGTVVTQAIDLSGKTKNTNATGNSPKYATNLIYGLGAVNMGSGGYMNTNGMTAVLGSVKGMTVIVTCKPMTTAASEYLCTTDQGDLQIFFSGGKWQVKCSGGTGASGITSITTGSWQIHSFVYDGNGSSNNQKLRYRYNKADQGLTITGTVAATANASNDNYIWGASDASSTNPFKGYIGEVLLWARALNPGEVAAVETYLGDKWGI